MCCFHGRWPSVTDMSGRSKLPLVYSCSGASSAAQMANYIAVRLDRLETAEMSCIAGVGGDVKPLVRTAKSGRAIIALDGCPLHCTAHILKRQGITADHHYDLSKMGVKKQYHEDFDPQEAARMLERIQSDLNAAAAPAESGAGVPTANDPTSDAVDGDKLEPASPPCLLDEFKEW